MKIKFLTLIIILSFIICSANLLAQERKKGEVCLVVGGVFGDEAGVGGMTNLGYYLSKGIGIEAGGIIGIFGEGVGALILGNVVVSPLGNQKFIPYATGGIWIGLSGGQGWNFGGGLKMMLGERLAIRTEYRLWLNTEDFFGNNSIMFGLSYFF